MAGPCVPLALRRRQQSGFCWRIGQHTAAADTVSGGETSRVRVFLSPCCHQQKIDPLRQIETQTKAGIRQRRKMAVFSRSEPPTNGRRGHLR